jgi:hypothetical protein
MIIAGENDGFNWHGLDKLSSAKYKRHHAQRGILDEDHHTIVLNIHQKRIPVATYQIDRQKKRRKVAAFVVFFSIRDYSTQKFSSSWTFYVIVSNKSGRPARGYGHRQDPSRR